MTEIKLADIPLKSNVEKIEKKQGVYVWGYYDKNQFIPLYVGKSRNIFERIIQHYCRYKGGEYQIQPNGNYTPTSLFNVLNIDFTDDSFRENVLKNFAFRFIEIETEKERELTERIVATKIGIENLITRISKLESSMIMNKIDEILDGIKIKPIIK